jgi:phosphoenolpyruvate phosphomutase
MRAAVTAMDRVFRRLVETGTLSAVEGDIASLKEIFHLVGFDEVNRIEERFIARPPAAADSDPGGGAAS